MIIVGVDPGASGGLAVIFPDGTVVTEPFRGLTLLGMYHVFQDLRVDCSERGLLMRAAIEEVHAMPKQGVASTFAFGRSFGHLEALMLAAGIAFERVQPRAWQGDLGLLRRNRDESKTAKKNRHKALAQELFPGVKVTHATADALLIAEWLRRREVK